MEAFTHAGFKPSYCLYVLHKMSAFPPGETFHHQALKDMTQEPDHCGQEE
jgi:hypothetical protein